MPTVESAPPAPVAAGSSGVFLGFAGGIPLRAELYGLDRLEAHARRLAGAAAATVVPGRPLLRHVAASGRALVAAHRAIADAYRRGAKFGAEAEWLLDNFHVIADALREVQTDMPAGYYRLLPKLGGGPLAGLPRVHALALDLIAHTDSSLDEANVTRYVLAFQAGVPLTIGELWAFPVMLRLGLLDNLRRLAEQVVHGYAERQAAAAWFGKHFPAEGSDRRAGSVAPPLPTHPERWSEPFLVHLINSLRDHGIGATRSVEWLESYCTGCGTSAAEVLRREQQRQAANQVTIGNCVTSLRLLSALDWTQFFENTSHTEEVLRQDPAGVYARQDAHTRDRYRQVVELLARGSGKDETTVARRVLELARRHGAESLSAHPSPQPSPLRGEGERDPSSPPLLAGEGAGGRGGHSGTEAAPANHVGHYLIGRGREELEADLGYRPLPGDRFRAFLRRHPSVVYFGSLAVATALALAGVAWYTLAQGTEAGWGTVALVLAVLLVPASELAVGLVHAYVVRLVPPTVLPRFAFRDGIPVDCATFVVVPCLLLRRESATVLLERLEAHYLADDDPQLRFALLTDFADAPQEHMPEDDDYLRAAVEGVAALNRRYCPEGPERFFLCHRRRTWNPTQGCWMGWERKRGKLAEFNRLLRGARDTNFTVTTGDLSTLPHVRYVITLDADTRLPLEAAQRLVATLSHPLNQPRFDLARRRVVSGYGILQPRIGLTMTGARKTLFSRVFSGSAGIDPYTVTVSDVYQDLFGVGSFTGKGIYDVDAFEAALGHTFPDNRILSHDLIEGNYARCGLVTDVELLDEFPPRYHTFARREHRWVRGDWQILAWLFPSVPGPGGSRQPNPLPLVERWKIFDNLRRSVLPPVLLVALVLGWTVLPGSPWFWSAVVLTVLGLPLLLQLVDLAMRLVWEPVRHNRLLVVPDTLGCTAGQVALKVVFLADQARLMMDAVTRTLFRLFISRRNLLEWETAASTERRLGTSFADSCRELWGSAALAVGLGVVLAVGWPAALPVALPVLALWLTAPATAHWVSRLRAEPRVDLSGEERRLLRRVARKTWLFFETFVTADDHWLPPDNYQEDPGGEVAHRTSPTNIGMYLLSCVAAHDFGYLSLPDLLARLERTLDTLEQLEQYHGHVLNWYDTTSLQPLPPAYVSTVDSGNLLGCLVALGQALREKESESLPRPAVCRGLADTLGLAVEALREVERPEWPEPIPEFRAVDETLREIEKALETEPVGLTVWDQWLAHLEGVCQRVKNQVAALGTELGGEPTDLVRWVRLLTDQVHGQREELSQVAPWLRLLQSEAGQQWLSAGRGAEWALVLTTPASLSDRQRALAPILEALSAPSEGGAEAEWLRGLARALGDGGVADLLTRARHLAARAAALRDRMDFRLLYNDRRRLFSIGYNLAHGRLDNAHYDLLASEASLTSFLAVARGVVPRRHWFQLARPLTRAGHTLALVSWSGTMFEYLMPRLLLKAPPGTVLAESQLGAVGRQIEYGRQCGTPWGVSESAFATVDAALNYQYQAFGVPGLGLKRGLGKELVIAPYAALLAVMVSPREVLRNCRRLSAAGAEGGYGYFEALDYTPERQQQAGQPVVVKCFMAHHQGMSLVALANCLLNDPMPRRFHAEPTVRATELLLQERIPQGVELSEPHADEAAAPVAVREAPSVMNRRLTTPNTGHPRTHLLSNGRYTVMLTNAGSGYSACEGLAVTRWREDRTLDPWGQFCYVRDLRGGAVWSAGFQPVCRAATEYEVTYALDKAEFRRRDGRIETRLEVTVSPECRAEVRRVTLTNHDTKPHDLEVTSYAEVVLGPAAADLAHPAFGKLFLETEFVAGSALLCRRRPRSADQKPVWAVHVVAVNGEALGGVQFETDRCRFLGRGRTPAKPAALDAGAGGSVPLGGATGAVLDPVFSLRRTARVAPDTSVTVAFTTAVADSREEALALADQFADFHGVNRAFELAWAHSQVELRHLQMTPEEAQLCQRLAAHLIYAGKQLRAPAATLTANRRGQSGLWGLGVSGDLPIALVRFSGSEDLTLVRQLVAAHTYWRVKGLVVDLVLFNEDQGGYRDDLQHQVQSLVRGSDERGLLDRPGGVFVRKAAQVPQDEQTLLFAAAQVVLDARRGTLARQLDRLDTPTALPPRMEQAADRPQEKNGHSDTLPETLGLPELQFANGVGGFLPDGREYVLRVATPGKAAGPSPRALPPAPWVNVVANPVCGFTVSETGAGATWAGNSQTNRLTPWRNDPVVPCWRGTTSVRTSPSPWPSRT
jgi:cyclic beta-1,2-glucan synthetase